jgi:hypothetical protein
MKLGSKPPVRRTLQLMRTGGKSGTTMVYYARECRRVDGKPTIVWQKYLGRAEDIIAALAPPRPDIHPPDRPREAVITDFGAVVALYDLAQRLELCDHIDRHLSLL